MRRLPRTLPSPKVAEQGGADSHFGITAPVGSVILDSASEGNSGDWMAGAEDSLPAVVGVRSGGAAGDLAQVGAAPRSLALAGELPGLMVAAAPGGTRERAARPAVRARRRPRAALSLLGPAFVVSVAYVDPGNFATNFAGGAGHGYALAWVVVMASLMAVLVQYLAGKVGLSTGRTLPELCRERFGFRVNAMLWVQAEAVAMATDLAEFVGAAIGLNLVFGLPLLAAGLVTAVVAFVILALEQRRRRFELAIIALLMLVGAGFAYLFLTAGDQDYGQLAAGLVPRLSGAGTLSLAVGIIGATVMPHVVYLHSALHKGRSGATSREERGRLLTSNKWDCVIGLGAAGLVNLAMLCVAAALFHKPGLTGVSDLGAVHSRLEALAGGGAALAFAVALMASGLSSSSVGTYAGQVIMAGFMRWHVPVMARRVVTMLPSLIVLALAVNPSQALVYSQVVLSFGIPFALVPLLLISRDRAVMTDMVNRRLTSGLMLLTTIIISALNLWLLYGAITGLAALQLRHPPNSLDLRLIQAFRRERPTAASMTKDVIPELSGQN
jgi:manganese transport protein